MYAIRENFDGGEWWTGKKFSPASDEAMLFDDEDEAVQHMRDNIEESIRVTGSVRVVEFCCRPWR